MIKLADFDELDDDDSSDGEPISASELKKAGWCPDCHFPIRDCECDDTSEQELNFD